MNDKEWINFAIVFNLKLIDLIVRTSSHIDRFVRLDGYKLFFAILERDGKSMKSDGEWQAI